jgi:hypothetical protein
MRELLESVQRLARNHGWFVFFRRPTMSGNPSKDKAEMKVLFDRLLDSYYDSQKK